MTSTITAQGSPPPAARSIDHVVLTRFNLPTPGPESLVRAKEGWLRNRVELFERHTVATMRAQTVRDFAWIIYFDPESPRWLVERLRPLIDAGLFTPLFRQEVGADDVVADARALTGARRDLLLTTNLDNDDAVAVDFLERLQRLARSHPHHALFLRRGLILAGGRLYLEDDPENAFCSVSESWAEPIGAWRDWHTMLRHHLPVVSEPGEPGWLQVVHGQNVSNRVRGRLVSAERYLGLFPGQLDDLAAPGSAEVWTERLLTGPLRAARSAARRTAKDAFLRVFGKAALDRVKSRAETAGWR